MNTGRAGSSVILCVCGLLCLGARALGQNGIFADFTTSMGNFTCQLDYTNAPKAVANFVGLATGEKVWMDIPAGQARTNAFYNGLTFHRVIADFMIQGGSPNGQGTDGPGYAFRDEFSPTLTFNTFGRLAMANSGTNSNGAQFFITVANTTWLNNVHTIFGRVTSGSNIVYRISRVATDASSKPLTNVVIQQVAIRRVGTAALAFDINGQGLPVVSNAPLNILRSGPGAVSLSYTNRLYADNHVFSATNLAGPWSDNPLGIELKSPVASSVDLTANAGRQFFRLTQIQYAHNTLAPPSVAGKTLIQVFKEGYFGTNRILFDTTNNGTFQFSSTNPASGDLGGYNYQQEPYRANLLIGLWSVIQAKHDFTSTTNGRFSGYSYPFYPYGFGAFPVSGTFTLTPP